MDVIVPPINQHPVLILGIINFDFERTIINDERVVRPAGLFPIHKKFVALYRYSINRFADFFDLDGVALITELGDKSHGINLEDGTNRDRQTRRGAARRCALPGRAIWRVRWRPARAIPGSAPVHDGARQSPQKRGQSPYEAKPPRRPSLGTLRR